MSSRLPLAPVVSFFPVAAASLQATDNRPVMLDVDAREAPRKIFHAKLTFPAVQGTLTLAYPKWIPGEHGPTGPIADLVGLKFSADKNPIPWKRDPADMDLFGVEVPPGAQSVEAALDSVSPAETGGFSSGSSANANLTLISWNQLLLYPVDRKPDEVSFAASLRPPEGWQWAGALEAAGQSAEGIRFEPVSLAMLVGLGMKVVAVNGRRWSPAILRDAIAWSGSREKPAR